MFNPSIYGYKGLKNTAMWSKYDNKLNISYVVDGNMNLLWAEYAARLHDLYYSLSFTPDVIHTNFRECFIHFFRALWKDSFRTQDSHNVIKLLAQDNGWNNTGLDMLMEDGPIKRLYRVYVKIWDWKVFLEDIISKTSLFSLERKKIKLHWQAIKNLKKQDETIRLKNST